MNAVHGAARSISHAHPLRGAPPPDDYNFRTRPKASAGTHTGIMNRNTAPRGQSQRAQWFRYLLRHWVLGLALLIISSGILEFGLGSEELFSSKFLRAVAVTLGATLLIAVALGDCGWRKGNAGRECLTRTGRLRRRRRARLEHSPHSELARTPAPAMDRGRSAASP